MLHHSVRKKWVITTIFIYRGVAASVKVSVDLLYNF